MPLPTRAACLFGLFLGAVGCGRATPTVVREARITARDAGSSTAPPTPAESTVAVCATASVAEPDVVIALETASEAASGRSPLDEPTSRVWPPASRWNDRMDREWSVFIERLGAAVRDRRCTRVDRCLRDPTANSLYDPQTDARMRLDDIDCADLPYVLRGYYAFKRRLPFGFVSAVRAHRARDIRYALDVYPTHWQSWNNFPRPRDVFHGAVDLAHSGMYRTPAEVEGGDFYPVRVTPATLRPGAIYYDPNGHVLVVAEVRADGVIHLIDGHPDGSLTWRRFGVGYAIGSHRLGGGFKNFRPLRWENHRLERTRNSELADLDPSAQWDRAQWTVAGVAGTYHDWVRASMARADAPVDPVRDFREQVQGVCRELVDRASMIEESRASGLAAGPHPNYLPWNIYGTTGDWETWSTPSRDARIRVLFRELRDVVAAQPAGGTNRTAMRAIWNEETARAECSVRYTASTGGSVTLTMGEVLDRLFALSFDPYHCPERRWGAPEGSAELARCGDDAVKRAWYRAEQRLRNQVDRQYGVATPLTFGPEQPPDVDPRGVLGR